MKTRITKHGNRAMTLIELLVVLCIVAFLSALVMPTLLRPHRQSKISCINNLKQTALALKIWAGDNNDKYPMQISVTNGGAMEWMETTNAWIALQVMSNELSTPKVILCPADSTRSYATNWGDNLKINISYFIGVDADDNNPQRLLSGDDNFVTNGTIVKSGLLALSTNTPPSWSAARHQHAGNIGLTDGSVQSTTSSGLRPYWQQTGLATNRIFVP